MGCRAARVCKQSRRRSYLPLANTISIFFDGGAALALNGKTYYPGASSAATVVMTMMDDLDSQNIEIVSQGSGAGSEGQHALMFQTTGCAFTGGCQ